MRGRQGKKKRSGLTFIVTLRAGGEVKVVENLPSKHEILSSNPVLQKKKKCCDLTFINIYSRFNIY
jgi:hypothetical protein